MRAATCARAIAALRRDRVGQLPSGAQRLGLAVHGGALPGRARAARRAAACSASGCRCTSSISRPCAASCGRSGGLSAGGWAMLASNSLETPVLGLVGARATRTASTPAAMRDRLARAALPRAAGRPRARGRVRACWAASSPGPRACGASPASAAANTDDHPVVAYRAPRITYAPDSLPARPADRAAARAVASSRPSCCAPTPDPAWPRRLAAYWVARDRFIESGRDVRPSPRRARTCWRRCASRCSPCCASVRIFVPAYDPLLRHGDGARRRSDARTARELSLRSAG